MPHTPYDFIDSSTDFVEGWSKFGSRESGDLPMLQYGVNGLGALASEPQAFRLFSTVDQRQIMEEVKENPSFGNKIVAALHSRGGAAVVAASAKRAALNELDGKSFPESKGEWLMLRRRLRVLARDIPAAIREQVEGMTLPEKTRALRALASGGGFSLQLGAEAVPAGGGDIWGGIIGSIATAAGSIYSAKLTNDANKDIAKIQASGVAAQAAAQNQIAQAQAALEAARVQSAARAASGGEVGGVPVWGIALGAIGILGVILYLVFKR